MNKIVKTLVLGSVFLSSQVFAQANWYKGPVERLALYKDDGSFVITLKNSVLDDCKHNYAYFDGATLGEGQLKAAYTMAITSLTTGVQMGVVIDKFTNGPDGYCYAVGMAADLTAN